MKQKLLNKLWLRVGMIVAIMTTALSGTAWADTSTLSFTSACGGSGTSDNGLMWTVASDGTESNFDSTSGIHYGTNKANVTYVTLTTSNLSSILSGKKITKIVVNARDAQSNATITVSVGSTTFTANSSNPTIANTSANFTFDGDATIESTDQVIVDVRRSSSMTKAIYVKSIVITYEDASAPSYTITAVSNDDSYGTVSGTTTITATPKDGYRVIAGDGGYTVISGTATVTNNGDNTFSVSASSDCTVRINFEAIPTYTVTIEAPTGGTLVVKNGDDALTSGGEVVEGTVLSVEVTPADGYNYTNWQYKLGDGSWNTRTSTYVTPEVTAAISIRANFAAKVYHDAIFQKYNGSEYVTHATKNTEEGQPIDFAGVSNPSDLDGRTFVGWVAAKIESPVDSPTPTFITSANMDNADVTYYACYAYCTPGSTATKTDKLTTATFGSPSSYGNWSNKQATSGSDAVYAGNSTTSSSGAIQIRTTNSNSGIVTTTSGGKAKKVTVEWDNETMDGRTLDIYGKNTAYSAATDLYGDNKGTKLGSIVCGTSTELVISGDYTYIGLRSNSNAMYLDEIDIDWQTGTPDTYSGYCTTVPADARTSVNIESFTATNTTLVIGGSPNTTVTAVTNDQDGWTESYIYTSDNTDVATVSDEGVITAVAKGTANITVTLNIPTSGGSYKKGTTSSKSIEITVTKPFHMVTFMANGSEVSSTSVEEDEDIVVPSDPSNVGNFSFQGWKEGSAIDGTQSSAPSYASISTMGNADVIYYAVYSVKKEVTATFDASDISNLTEITTNQWRHNATGISLTLSAGQHYTTGSPKTFTVSKGTSNYFEITTPTGGVLTKIVTEVSTSSFKIKAVTSGANLTSSSTTQTISFSSSLSFVRCYAYDNYQIRATSIVVDATLYENFCTTIPSYSVTVGSAGYTSYVAENNVSFPVGATAYIATATDASTVTLEEVLAVPTGTAVVVKGTVGTYDLDIEASVDCDDVSSNLLKAGPVVSDGSTIFALGIGKTGANAGKPGFYLVKSGVTVPSGKAYLDLDGVLVKEFLTFSFDDDATGINSLTPALSEGEGSIYNLAGQRMNKMQKGINIVNGKKVMK